MKYTQLIPIRIGRYADKYSFRVRIINGVRYVMQFVEFSKAKSKRRKANKQSRKSRKINRKK